MGSYIRNSGTKEVMILQEWARSVPTLPNIVHET